MTTAVLLAALLQQGSGWVATTPRPTVGDTIWVERTIPAPAGWRVRAARLDPGPVSEPLGDPVVVAAEGGWSVRYPIAVWAPGVVSTEMPPIWRLGPDGSADSLPGGTATVRVASVIPDSVFNPTPRPALAPLRLSRRTPLPALAGVLLSAGMRRVKQRPSL